LQIDRNQDRKGSNLGHADAGRYRLLVPRLKRFPERLLAVGLIKRNDAQRPPKLVQTAKHGGFSEFATEFFLNLGCRQNAATFQQLPYVGNERGDAVSADGARRVLPVAISAQSVDEGEGLGAGQKIGIIAGGAKQVERQS